MEVAIDIESINSSASCKFGQKCLEEFNSSLCCEIMKEGSSYLFVTPVSTFKSSNCTFVRKIKHDNQDVNICTCPVRLNIYQKYNI